LSRDFSQKGRGCASVARILGDISPHRLADSPSTAPAKPTTVPGACCSPHRAANRLVQKAFRIGVPMRKAFSVYAGDMHKHISHYGLRQKNAPSEFDRHAQVQSSQGDVDHVGFLGAGDNVRQHDWVILGWNVRLRGMRDGAGIKKG
jgi:hypothetical protein